MEDIVHCFNKGCGQKYSVKENNSTACVFHPGNPIFHDAKKKWSCCGKYSTDFSEFLSIKGCATGLHSNVKPVAPPEPQQEINSELLEQLNNADDKKDKSIEKTPTPNIQYKRPDNPTELVKIQVDVKQSLATALEQCEIAKGQSAQNGSDAFSTEIAIGTKCFNSSCNSVYAGSDSEAELCLYHPGVSIFHEGAKYWSCCQKKTSDFESFLAQVGCTTGKHAWNKQSATAKNLALQVTGQETSRFDWFQTSSTVTINIYSKKILPATCKIKANEIALTVSFQFDAGKSFFQKNFNLFGPIDCSNSVVNLMATKAEICLRKARPMSWNRLELQPTANNND